MKNIWILNHYAQDPNSSGGTRHFHLGQELLNFGWQTSIIRASTNHKTGKQHLNRHENQKLDHIDGVQFLSIKTPSYQGNGKDRIFNMLAYFFRSLLPRTLDSLNKPNVIIGSSVHPLAALAGCILAKRYKVPFLFEVRDLWPQTLIDMGNIKEKSIKSFVLKFLEKWLYTKASRIIVLLPKAKNYIQSIGISQDKVVYIPNGISMSSFPPPLQIKKNSNEFKFMYFGAHGKANGLENILYAMEILKREKNKEITFHLIGDGPSKEALQQLAQKMKLDNVYFLDAIPKKKIPNIASTADAFIFNLIDAPVFQFGISSNKIFEFMASGRPIIFCCNAANNPIAEAGAGVTVPPNAPSELASAMTELAGYSIEKRSTLGKAGYLYVSKNHDFKSLAHKLSKTLNQVINTSS